MLLSKMIKNAKKPSGKDPRISEEWLECFEILGKIGMILNTDFHFENRCLINWLR
jgi:hypothetical protein